MQKAGVGGGEGSGERPGKAHSWDPQPLPPRDHVREQKGEVQAEPVWNLLVDSFLRKVRLDPKDGFQASELQF